MADLIVLRTYYHKHDAQIAQGLLIDSGVDAVVSSDDVGGFRPHVSLSMNNVRLMVRDSDVEKAKDVLRVLEETVDEEQLREIAERAVAAIPEEKEGVPKRKKQVEASLIIPLIIAFLFVLFYVVKKVNRQALDYGIFGQEGNKTSENR